MTGKKVNLYDRLPEIYRIKDSEQAPPDQLRSYLAAVESVFDAIHENIETLYENLFIESCEDWVIPYIGDLLGTSHLKGDPWTLRADVADTISLRRKKGTLASIERLTYNLTSWGVHCTELRDSLIWSQHLNHMRFIPPALRDLGGSNVSNTSGISSDYRSCEDNGSGEHLTGNRFLPVRGGTVTLRDPAMLSLVNTPFDPFSHIPDLKPPAFGNIRYNLPNLAIFLWRLKDYRVRISKPFFRGAKANGDVWVVRFDIHPTGEPVTLFNTYRFDPDAEPPVVTGLDATPGPIPRARLIKGAETGIPEQYLAIDSYSPTATEWSPWDISDVGLHLHLPEPEFRGQDWPKEGTDLWKIRGENLCAWETGIQPHVRDREIVIDPDIGRVLIGVANRQEAEALEHHLLVSYTYGFPGEIGAHPISQSGNNSGVQEGSELRDVLYHDDPMALTRALSDISETGDNVIIEINDSMTHLLDPNDPSFRGQSKKHKEPNIVLGRSLTIRAGDGQRPVIKLSSPLRFQPSDVSMAGTLTVRLEGLYITRDPGFPKGEPLIERAALNRLEIVNCTLDPGGFRRLHGSRTGIHDSLVLRNGYGFNEAERGEFDQIPEIVIQGSICGPILIDREYDLTIMDSIIDAGKGMDEDPMGSFAVSGATDRVHGWGPPALVSGITVFGRMRVESIMGRGGLWVQPLEVLNDQVGCIRYSYLSGNHDRIPQNLGCVRGYEAELRFVSDEFGDPGYGQLAHTTDYRIREQGPNADAMGAFGFLLEAHAWRNIQIRFREFMPVGVRPLFIPVT